jgi:hypothetical protein
MPSDDARRGIPAFRPPSQRGSQPDQVVHENAEKNSIQNGYVTSSSNHKLVGLTREVSQHVGIRQDVVDLVLRGFFDIMIERIIRDGKFKVYGLFSIKNHEWKGYTAGDGESAAEVKGRRRLKVSLGYPLLELWKVREDKGEEFAQAITRDNWRQVLDRFVTAPKKRKSAKKVAHPAHNPFAKRTQPAPSVNRFPDAEDNDSDYNPFLDDDE